MIYALDTNTVSFVLRGNKLIRQRWLSEERSGNSVLIPLIAYYEIKRGLFYANAASKLAAFEQLCKKMIIDDLNVSDVSIAARIYAENRRKGLSIGDGDTLIAAQSISRGYILVTNNTRHFVNISGLKTEDWSL
jgi:predicted nucleic acid-binding protein